MREMKDEAPRLGTSRLAAYDAAGVDTDKEEAGLQRLIRRVRDTWPRQQEGFGSVRLDVGLFANVVDVGGGMGLAITTDGVGSKVVVAQMMGRYDTVGIDCVAMNVNDLLCVGATPLSMVDYIALDVADPEFIEELSKGLCEGAAQAGVSVTGGEIAQLGDLLKQGQGGGYAFDFAGTAVGMVPLDRIIVGQSLEEGDALIGIASNGIHSNGLTLARQVLFERQGLSVDSRPAELDVSLGEELLKPTHIYVREVLALLKADVGVKALAHITSDGLLNLTRVVAPVGYVVDWLPATPAIFSLIQKLGDIPTQEMFRVFNMGVGFCLVVPPNEVQQTLAILRRHGRDAWQLGSVVHDPEQRVHVKPAGIVGQRKRFQPA